jgi:hypothetical protein
LLEVSGNLGANLSAGTSDNVWNIFFRISQRISKRSGTGWGFYNASE